MFKPPSTLFTSFYLFIILFISCGSITEKSQYIIVYITSSSAISPIVFETSFNVFQSSLQSVIMDTLPSLSASFNITEINLWCLPDTNTDIYSSFYIVIDYTDINTPNDILSSIIDRMNNDLLPQILIDKIETIDSESPLIHFIFETYHITAALNASFIIGDMDCISYLMDTQNMRSLPSSIEDVINHDNDDFVQFIFYGATVHWKVFIIWSIVCIVIGMFICTSIVCIHIDLTERRRKRNKKKIQKQKRLQRNDYLSEQTPSLVTTSHMHLSPISINYHDNKDDHDTIAIIRPNNTRNIDIKRRNKCISIQKVKSNSVTIDSRQSQLIRQQYKARKRAKSLINNRKRGYDKIDNFDEEKEEELIVFNDDMSLDNIQIMEENNDIRRGSTETQKTQNTEKIVTVHVHHHYNPNEHQSPIQFNEQKEESYPDLPYEARFNFNNNHNISPHYIAINSPISDETNEKELSKSQREGFSPFTTHSEQQKGVRGSIASQKDDVSDSELMYAPGPAADDTPGQNQTPFSNCK